MTKVNKETRRPGLSVEDERRRKQPGGSCRKIFARFFGREDAERLKEHLNNLDQVFLAIITPEFIN
jgi:hypothetical protein